MKKLLIVTRGVLGCGKSTWIRNNNLQDYTLAPDDLRLMCVAPYKLPDGSYRISQDGEVFVWKILEEMLLHRLQHGYLTVIDATASKLRDIKHYKALADEFGYKLVVIDFADVDLATCLRQNQSRLQLRWVPDDIILKYSQRLSSQAKQVEELKQQIKFVKPNEFKLEDF